MRKVAREICFELIFENLFKNEDDLNAISFDLLCKEENALNEEDLKFVEDLFNSYICNKKHIAEMISAKLIGFSSERTYIVDMALLNLAIAEICFLKLTDVKIVINETIELAKKFSTDKSPKFINGILGAIVKEQ